MSKSPPNTNPKLVLAVWPNESNINSFFGTRDYGLTSDCDSFWLQLRVEQNQNEGDYRLREAARCVGLWVWFAGKDSVNVEVRAHDIHSASEAQLANILALVRKLGKKVPPRQHGWSLELYLSECLKALGIRKWVEYRPRAEDVEQSIDWGQVLELVTKRQQRLAHFKETA